jgi:CSLREA domain-containing protein
MVPLLRPAAPVRLAALVSLTLLAAACGGSSSRASLVAIAVTPAPAYVDVGGTVQLAATGTYSDATTRDLTAEATWTSSDAAVATVSDAAGTKGLVSAVAQGPVTITAAFDAVPGEASVSVAAVVNTAADTVAADGHCSLREALLNAAAMDQSGSTDCAAGDGHNVIRFDLPSPTTIALTAQLPTVVNQVTIRGPEGEQLGLFGDDAVGLLAVGGGATLRLSDLTLANGSAGQGGAVLVSGGTLVVERVAFRTNGANPGSGGAIANLGGTVQVSASTFADSYASGAGGAVYNSTGGVLELDGCVFDGNVSDDNGGAIYNRGVLTAIGCTFDGNAAGMSSGAIYNLSATLAVDASTFLHNAAASAGGAIGNYSGAVATIARSTFALNRAGPWGGGAVYVRDAGSTMAVSYSSFSANTAAGGGAAIGNGGSGEDGGTVTLAATLLSYNQVSTATVNCFNQPGGTLQDGGYNLEDADTCTLGTGSWKSTDPGPLEPADNGGGTQTLALSASSAARDRVPAGAAGCGTTVSADQRGVARPQGAGCDVGAYERE